MLAIGRDTVTKKTLLFRVCALAARGPEHGVLRKIVVLLCSLHHWGRHSLACTTQPQYGCGSVANFNLIMMPIQRADYGDSD